MRHSPAQLIRSTHAPIIIVALGLLTFGQIQAESAPEPAGVAVLLIEALQSDDSYVRQNAALALERLPPEAATLVLLAALDSDDTFVRQRAAKSLITIAGGTPVEVMRAALQDDDAGVRHYAASALDNLGPRTLVPIMSMALESDDPAVRELKALVQRHFGHEGGRSPRVQITAAVMAELVREAEDERRLAAGSKAAGKAQDGHAFGFQVGAQ